MPTTAAYRAKIGVITPSTNTSVEFDLNHLPLPGISWHIGRMYIERPALDSDEAFVDLVEQVRDSMDVAIRDVMTAKPDHLMLGMSAPAFWGGVDGAEELKRHIAEVAGVNVSITTPASACSSGLSALEARDISILTPYQPVADENVRRFFSESGFSVRSLIGLKIPVATDIARTPTDRVIGALRELALEGSDVILQAGADLSLLHLADEAERWLGTPVVAMNIACGWHAVRALGVTDRFPGFGPLFREF